MNREKVMIRLRLSGNVDELSDQSEFLLRPQRGKSVQSATNKGVLVKECLYLPVIFFVRNYLLPFKTKRGGKRPIALPFTSS